MKRKHRRLSLVALALMALGTATSLVLVALEEDIVFFFSPTEIMDRKAELKPDQRLRMGGLVEEGTVAKQGDGITVNFGVTDMEESLMVSYKGILPDLFREGQGVVVQGTFVNGIFVADEVLAKHDENYMPPEVAEALKKSGHWEEFEEKMGERARQGNPGNDY